MTLDLKYTDTDLWENINIAHSGHCLKAVMTYPRWSYNHAIPQFHFHVIFVIEAPAGHAVTTTFLTFLQLVKKTEAPWHYYNNNHRNIYTNRVLYLCMHQCKSKVNVNLVKQSASTYWWCFGEVVQSPEQGQRLDVLWHCPEVSAWRCTITILWCCGGCEDTQMSWMNEDCLVCCALVATSPPHPRIFVGWPRTTHHGFHCWTQHLTCWLEDCCKILHCSP